MHRQAKWSIIYYASVIIMSYIYSLDRIRRPYDTQNLLAGTIHSFTIHPIGTFVPIEWCQKCESYCI